MSKANKKEKLRFLVITIVSTAIIFAGLLIISLGVYRFDWNNRFMQFSERVIPFPAVYVKGAGIVTIGEVKKDSKAVQKFYESQDFDQVGMRVDFSTDQGKKRLKIKEKDIVNKLIENKIIEALAKKREIFISDTTAEEEINRNIDQFSNRQNLMSELNRLYGWSLENFKEKVVKPELYGEKLSEAYSTEIDTAPQEKKIKSLYERVASKKEDFAKVAQETSDGQSSNNGGDLGWSAKDQLVAEVGDAAFSMKQGQISDVIASPLGFHVIKLEEIKNDNGETLVHLRQIFIKKTTFSDWLKDQMRKYQVLVFLKDYQWNAGDARIEFKNSDLRSFEENLDVNSTGDPSIF
jgi:parvulin-like peptidyl-prolyl isomerase